MGGSKESSGGTVTLYGYPATAAGAASSGLVFRAIVVERAVCLLLLASWACVLTLGGVPEVWQRLRSLVGLGVALCLRRLPPRLLFCLGCLLRLVLSVEVGGKAPVPAFGEGLGV